MFYTEQHSGQVYLVVPHARIRVRLETGKNYHFTGIGNQTKGAVYVNEVEVARWGLGVTVVHTL